MSCRPNHDLPNIFPDIGPATSLVLFADIAEPDMPTTEDDWINELNVIVTQGLAGTACRILRSAQSRCQRMR